MLVFLNGEIVPAEEAVVSVFDRGFLYGDGLFETFAVIDAIPLRWDAHWRRLTAGAAALRLKLPFDSEFLRDQAIELCWANELEEPTLRLTVSRGIGERGYSPRGADEPTVVMSVHLSPLHTERAAQVKLHTSSHRISADDPLAAHKTANKLLHVLARAEADAAGADEALLLHSRGELAEATSANLFWLEGNALHTPPLTAGAQPGITRADVLAWSRTNQITAHETSADLTRLRAANGVFLTSSACGVVEVVALDGQPLATSPFTQRIRDALLDLWRAEAESHRMKS
ncbi:MAG: aminotransferase class IV [Limisphaerales bacterium]